MERGLEAYRASKKGSGCPQGSEGIFFVQSLPGLCPHAKRLGDLTLPRSLAASHPLPPLPPPPHPKAVPIGGERCSEGTMAKDIERDCYLFQARSQKNVSKNIEQRYFIVQPDCNYAFKMFNVCKRISCFRWWKTLAGGAGEAGLETVRSEGFRRDSSRAANQATFRRSRGQLEEGVATFTQEGYFCFGLVGSPLPDCSKSLSTFRSGSAAAERGCLSP